MTYTKTAIFRLDNKVALVTGCGSIGPGLGNGKAISTLFARQGAHVYGVDLTLKAASVTHDAILEEGGACAIAAYDVTSGGAVEAMVADCVAKFGHIDILVNNVGRSEPGGPAELDEQSWDGQFDVNVKSAFLTCKHVLPLMEAQGRGAIVNISSVAGLRYIGKAQVTYAAAKAALMQMSRTTAVLYAAMGIRINCVLPGLMDTPLVRRLADKYAGGDFEDFVATRNRQVPIGRMGDAWDVAHAALFLAADESSYVTGTEVVVDGALIAATR